VKPFTPAKIKADVIFAASLAATFGFKLSDSVSIALIGGAALIAAGLNFGEALLERYDPKLLAKLEGDLAGLGPVFAELKTAIEALKPATLFAPSASPTWLTLDTPNTSPTKGTMEPVTISVQNLTSHFTDKHVEGMAAALWAQARDQYNLSCWVTEGLAAPVATVTFVAHGEHPPANTFHIELLDNSDQEGALGYHEDEAFDSKIEGKERSAMPTVSADSPTRHPTKASARSSRGLRADSPEHPLAKVFVETSLQDGVWPSEVASHEMLEMLVDPQVVSGLRTVQRPAEGRTYVVEVCDAVQSTGKVLAGFLLSNFCLPAYFGYPQSVNPEQYDFEHVLSAPVPAMTDGGYLSYTAIPPAGWTQIHG